MQRKPQPLRYFGAKRLDPTHPMGDTDKATKEVIHHLTKLVGAQSEITREVHATLSKGVSDNVIHTVNENNRTLKFSDFGFQDG